MSSILLRAAVAVLVFTFVLGTSVQVSAGSSAIVVRVYDSSFANARFRQHALGLAARIVKDGGVVVEWLDCTDGTVHACRVPARGRSLIVRLMPEPPQAEAPDRATVDDRRLGSAIVDARTHRGTLATVYLNRVAAVAARTGVNGSRLLGRALAHEIGHLLMHSAGHSDRGLMRALWTDAELVEDRADDWVFSPLDRKLLAVAAAADGFAIPAPPVDRRASIEQTASAPASATIYDLESAR